MLLEPKDIIIDNKNFVLSKFPAIAGREIITQYPLSAAPKIGEYQTNQDLMLKLMAFVGVRLSNNQILQLTTVDLINNHTGGWETLMRLEWEQINYNCSFLANGSLSNFLKDLIEMLPAWITQTWTDSSAPLSQVDLQVTESLKKASHLKTQ